MLSRAEGAVLLKLGELYGPVYIKSILMKSLIITYMSCYFVATQQKSNKINTLR